MAENGDVLRLQDSVAYQDGSIVSRKIVSSAGGNITAFAFDAGEELSEHTTPHTALIQIVDGRAEIRIEDRTYGVGAGESIVLPPGRPHAVRAVERFKMLLTMLKAAT